MEGFSLVNKSLDQSLRTFPQKLIIISCAHCKGALPQAQYENFLGEAEKMISTLKSNSAELALVRFPEPLKPLVTIKFGKDIRFFQNIFEVTSKRNVPYEPKEELEVLKQNAIQYFKVQFGMDVQTESMTKAATPLPFQDQVVSMIPLVSTKFLGSMLIRLSNECLETLGFRLLQRHLKVPDQDLLEVSAEIANMIFGYSREAFNSRGYGIQQAVPQVYCNNGTLNVNLTGEYWRVMLHSEVGSISLEAGFQER